MIAGGEARPGAPGRLLPILLAALFAVQIYAFHWGVITPDTVFQWGQAVSGRYDDWHPPATTWLWRQLMALGPGSAPILVFQCLLYWAGVGLIADALRRRGARRAMAVVVIAAALPIPFGQFGSILKDPLLAGCCLVAAGLLLASEGQARRRRAAFALAFLLLLFASATRFNAVFATAPLLAAWLPDRRLAGFGRALPALGACALLLGGGGWAIDTLALRPHSAQPIFSLVNFDLAGIVAQGGANPYPDLDAATARRVAAACYDPGQFNPHYREDCDAVEIALSDYAAAHHRSGASILLAGMATSPVAYLRHRIAHLNRNWRFLVGSVPYDAVYLMKTPDNRFGLVFTENAATRAIAHAGQGMALSPLGRPATWIAVAAGLLMAGGGLRARRFVLGTALSAIGYGCGYALFSVAPDMRYNLWTMLAAMLALAVAAAELRGRQWIVALTPAVLTVSAELVALVLP